MSLYNKVISFFKRLKGMMFLRGKLTWAWGFGSMLGFLLFMQIITGLVLSVSYVAETDVAFETVIMNRYDLFIGWLFRGMHSTGASFFFIVMYLHMARNIYYSLYRRKAVWTVGMFMLILSMAAAFSGYVLIWGQMSYWGVTVITNMVTVIPYVGDSLASFIWGGYTVGDATLTRFFTLHFFSPFIIGILAIVHVILLHTGEGQNISAWEQNVADVAFHPMFSFKDFSGFFFVFLALLFVTLGFPHLFTEPENFIPANTLSAPAHIKPEWYFLWAYAMLRSVPYKSAGIAIVLASFVCFFLLPWSGGYYIQGFFAHFLFFLFLVNAIFLSWLGGQAAIEPYILWSQYSSMFFFFLLYMSIFGSYPPKVFPEDYRAPSVKDDCSKVERG